MSQDLEQKFQLAFDSEDKEQCVVLVQDALRNKAISIVDLYTRILAPALNKIFCAAEDFECIWKEHVKTGIVRTIIESCYPMILTARMDMGFEKTAKKMMVFCPPDEYHEIGARMVADFFTLVGFSVIYVGNNTPKKSFLNAIERISPDFVAISVSNPYHLFQTKETINSIRKSCPATVRIIVGGNAFQKNPNTYKEIGADYCFNTFDEIVQFRRQI
jgi:methanogenic corrinoid protein MtbC1